MQAELKAEFSAELAFSFHDLQQLLEARYAELSTLATKLTQTQDRAVETLTAFDRASAAGEARLARLETTLTEARGDLIKLATNFHDRIAKMEGGVREKSRDLLEIVDKLDAAKAEMEVLFNALAARQNEISSSVGRLAPSLAAGSEDLKNLLSEMQNLVAHLQTSSETRFHGIENVQSEIRNLVTHISTNLDSRLNRLENAELPSLSQEIHGLADLQFRQIGAANTNARQPEASSEERYERARPAAFESYLARARGDFPGAYPLWKERLDSMRDAFRTTKVGNAAHGGDIYSRLFRSFVEIHAGGRVLDVGCGVFGRPYYLAAYPAGLISGLDPLAPVEPHDFEFVQGISELLPWPDQSFSTVISATSLDHCLSLDRSLAEIRRVLRPGGKFLLWIGSVPGAIKPNPEALDLAAADKYHLFHFDSAWLEPLLDLGFETSDRLEFRRPGYSHVMYSLTPKT